MQDRLGEEWYSILKDEFNKDYMLKLQSFLANRRETHIVYPPQNEVFNAYKLTQYSKVKVCILGQDPYINGEAHGLAFSTKNGIYTPTLQKISEVLKSEVWDNNLTRWAKQGVLLINKTLTVDAGHSTSHIGKGWEDFTIKTIKELDKKGNVVFMLWGSYAKEYDNYITKGLNSVIMCEHPVFASYRNRKWNNNDCFNICNQILRDLGETPIIW